MSLSVKSQTIVLKNNTAQQRHEVVEVENLKVDSQMVLFDAFGVEQPYQWTHDGKLLLFASIRPNGTATYTLKSKSNFDFSRRQVKLARPTNNLKEESIKCRKQSSAKNSG